MTDQTRPQFVVTASNDFNGGWLAYILGLPRPEDPMAAEGWDTGMETTSLNSVRYVMETQRKLPDDVRQYVVTPPMPVQSRG